MRSITSLLNKKITEQVKKSVSQLLPNIPKEYRQHFDIDAIHKRLFISHDFFLKAITWAASHRDEIEIQEIVPLSNEEGYLCKVLLDKHLISLIIRLKKIEYESRKATVWLETPDSITIENKPVVTFFARAFTSILGGRSLGEKILSSKLPPNVSWDAKIAKCTFDIPEKYSPGWLGSTAFILEARHECRGIWFVFNSLETFVNWIGKIVKPFIPKRFIGI